MCYATESIFSASSDGEENIMSKIATLLIAAAVILVPMQLPAETASTYAPVTVPMSPKKLSEDVYYVEGLAGIATAFEGFISNAGFVVTDEGVVVFDALGTPSLAWQLRQEIRKITEIIAPAEAERYIEGGLGQERLEERTLSLDPWVTEETRLVSPDVWLDKSMTMEMGGKRMTILHLGKAHSDGDMAMLVEPDKVLFTGDILFEGRVPFVGSADTKGWLEALESMQTTGLKALVPGHGPAASDPDAAIVMTRDYLAYLREIMGAAVEDLVDFDEAYAEADWSRFEKLPAFEAANRVNAYAVYLSMSDEALE